MISKIAMANPPWPTRNGQPVLEEAMPVAITRSSAVLTSQADGSKQIYWSAPQGSGQFQGSVALLINLFAVVLTNALWRLRGQYSVDGVTWLDVGTTGYIDGLSAPSSTLGAFSYPFAAPANVLAGQYRIGVEITGSGAQGLAQLNLDVTPLSTPLAQNVRVSSGNVSASSTGAQLGSDINTLAFQRCRLSVKIPGTSTSTDSLTVIVKTGMSDLTMATAYSQTIAAGQHEASFEVETLGANTSVWYVTGGSWTTCPATFDLMLRPD